MISNLCFGDAKEIMEYFAQALMQTSASQLSASSFSECHGKAENYNDGRHSIQNHHPLNSARHA